MAQDYAELERSARLLSPEERARLAEAMTESLRDAIPQDVEAECEQGVTVAYSGGRDAARFNKAVYTDARKSGARR